MPHTDSPSVPQKRRRTESTHSEPAAEPSVPVSRSSFWLDDGSIVLQAESTQFKIHRTMLSRHSSVFKDMFAIVHPSESEPSVEGCPLVHLSDSAQDVTYLLEALYDQTYTSRSVLPFPVVAALLRLGTKYDFNGLREEALVRLRSEFPSTLKEWEHLPCEYSHMQNQDGILFNIIKLALEQGIGSILPVAYYLCIQALDDILDGIPCEDGTTAQLPPEVQRTCILGREKILVAQAENTLSWLDNEYISNSCVSGEMCQATCAALTRVVYKPLAHPGRSLEKWSQIIKGPLCAACVTDGKAAHETGRQAMWDMMPGFFGLPAWEELKRLDR